MKKITYFILLSSLFLTYCSSTRPKIKVNHIPATAKLQSVDSSQVKSPVLSGLDNLLNNYLHLLKDKRVGLVTNPSAVNKDYQFAADLLFEHPQVNLVALFGVEHGVRGDVSGGDKIDDFEDPKTGLPVYSLYGKTRKPTKEMLQNIDVIIFDIQDVGIRTYTYISSMGNVIEAAAEYDVPVFILDRPNPLGGLLVEGNILDMDYKSYIGYYPIPYCHGMTIGEIATMYNQENSLGARLTVIPLKNWERDMLWDKTGLPWVPTSPHVPHWETTLFLPITGTIGELQSINIGVGYTSPFEFIGTPWMDADVLADSLNKLNLPGLHFRPVHYKPYYATYKEENCHGVQVYITDAGSFRPFTAGLHILATIMKLYPDHNVFEHERRIRTFHLVMGGTEIYDALTSGKSVAHIEQEWQEELSRFMKIREKYLLY